MYFEYKDNKKVFCGGREDWEKAEAAAKSCSFFKEDADEELAADAPRTCYNCRYRRWTGESFVCIKGSR
jgi:hypothetical protein